MNHFSLVSDLPTEIFRAYDIRGIVNQSLSPDIVYTLGCAIASQAQTQGAKEIILGRDGRLSGPTLFSALKEGVLDTGCNIIDIGMVPTPILYFATHHLQCPFGIMLTGSHNPAQYNGLKIVLDGQTLSGEEIQKIQHRIIEKNYTLRKPGRQKIEHIIPDYIYYVNEHLQLKKRLKIVIDCGNGITGNVAPFLFRKLGCEVIELYCDVDGNFPNHHPDPSDPQNLQDLSQAVLKHKADLGLAFDGDGDRIGIVTNMGEVIWPDRQLMLFAEDVLQKFPNSQIIFDVKCTRHLQKEIEKNNGKAIMTKTGHSLIKAKMRHLNAPLAGEMSGHIFFNDRWFGFDDGMYAGARLLEILSDSDKSVHEIFQAFPNSINTPELKLPIAEEIKFQWIEKFINQAKFTDATISTIDGLRIDFIDGFGLIRPSNTSPYLTMRFEGDNHEALKRIKQEFREQLMQYDANLKLPADMLSTLD